MVAPDNEQGLEAPVRKLQYAIDHPVAVVSIDGQPFTCSEFEFVSARGNSSDFDPSEIIEGALDEDNTILVELYVSPTRRGGASYEIGDEVRVDGIPDELPFLQHLSWEVKKAEGDDLGMEYLLQAKITVDDLRY